MLTRLNAQSLGGYTSGAVAFCDSVNSGFISLNNYTGLILEWQSTTDNGNTWSSISNITSVQSYNNLHKTTGFRAIVKDGIFLPDTSTSAFVIVQVKGETGSMSGGGVFCQETGSGTITLSGYAGDVVHWEYTTSEAAGWTVLNTTNHQLLYAGMTQSTRYRAIVHAQSICPNDTTATVVFQIDQRSAAGSIYGSDSLCYGSAGDTLLLSGITGSVSGWDVSTNSGGSWTSLNIENAFFIYPVAKETQWYRVRVKNGVCPFVTSPPAIVAVHAVNNANAGEDVTITRYDPLTLNGTGNGRPAWSPAASLSDAGSFSPQALPTNTTVYALMLTDAHGCMTYDSVLVNVIIPIPTAITPNGDAVNDYFIIDKIENYPANSLLVFNRWGNTVYSASPYTNTWNGKSDGGHNLPDDMYYYVFDPGKGEKIITNYILIKR